jgi:hypothetical protein
MTLAAGGWVWGDVQRQYADTEAALKKEAEDARDEAVKQKGIALQERDRAEANFKRAERNFRSANEAVERMLTRVR